MIDHDLGVTNVMGVVDPDRVASFFANFRLYVCSTLVLIILFKRIDVTPAPQRTDNGS